jgi:hypothetical protein
VRAAILVLALAGCFDSLVSDPCARGYTLEAGHCVARETPDAGVVDAPPVLLVDAGPTPDAPVCTADIANDPDNCGACGVVCASGACSAGMCLGAVPGHIVAIGHDYRHHHAAMARLLGDAVALGAHLDVGVARWGGSTDEVATAGTSAALAAGMTAIGRPWHVVAMPPSPSALAGIDVVVIDAQLGDGAALEATGTTWRGALDTFLARGGVIVVLDGPGTRSYRLAAGAGLYTIAPPADCTDALATVTNGADAVAQQVLSPYAAERGSVTLPGIAGVVVSTASGDPIVAHLTR